MSFTPRRTSRSPSTTRSRSRSNSKVRKAHHNRNAPKASDNHLKFRHYQFSTNTKVRDHEKPGESDDTNANNKQKQLFRVPRLSIAPMVDVTNIFFRLLNRMVSHNTTLYTEMIVDKQILNSLPFTRASIGIMHPNESATFFNNMKRFYAEQQYKKHLTLDTMMATDSNKLLDSMRADGLSLKPFGNNNNNNKIQAFENNNNNNNNRKQKEIVLPSINPIYPFGKGGGCVAQISGADGYELIAASQLLQTLGYDVINVNFGCPASSASSGLHGAILMVSEDVEKQIERLRSNPTIHVPVTIKCRIGVDRPADYRWFKEWMMSYITHTGVSSFTVHSRIAKLNFNPKKNLNIPPLHQEFIHYLQTDIRQYVSNEKIKLFKIMEDYYSQQSTQKTDDEPPFGITGRQKNACMYYIDPITKKKCYVPLAVCLEYNGGATSPAQTAELAWALNENGGYKLRPRLNPYDDLTKMKPEDNTTDVQTTNPESNTNDNNEDDVIQISQLHNIQSNDDDMSLYDYFNYRNHQTMQHEPHSSTHDGLTSEHIKIKDTANRVDLLKLAEDKLGKDQVDIQDDFLWMNKKYRKQHDIENIVVESYTKADGNNNNNIVQNDEQEEQLNLKQPLLPGVMVGRADMGDVLFPLFYDAFYHSMVLASNGKLDKIPGLVLPNYEDKQKQLQFKPIDDVITEGGDYYDHTAPDYDGPPTAKKIKKLSNNDNGSIDGEEAEDVDANKILYNLLQQHLHTDPIIHNSTTYIDVETGDWVKRSSKKIGKENNNKTKRVYDLTDAEKIDLIKPYPSEAYPELGDNPSRLDLLCVYLDEVDKLLFQPQYAHNLQLQYELSIEQSATTNDQSSQQQINDDNNTSTTSKNNTTTTSKQNKANHVSFLDNTTPTINPHETIELAKKYNMTPYDQEALLTAVTNPVAPQLSLQNQPYPFEKDNSKCSFTINDDDNESNTTTNIIIPNGVAPPQNKQHPFYNTPHTFVEHICKVIIAQELLDLTVLLDSLSYQVQKKFYELDKVRNKSKRPARPNKEHVLLELDLIYKGIIQFMRHPFVDKTLHKYQLHCQQFDAAQIAQGKTLTDAHPDIPQWLAGVPEFHLVLKYAPVMNALQQYLIKQNIQPDDIKTQQRVMNDFITNLMRNEFITPGEIAKKQQNPEIAELYNQCTLSFLKHPECVSNIVRSKALTYVNKLQRITESQSVTSLFYGYLYGISDMFLRPLGTLFANTEANEHWRRIVHTACLIARGSPGDVFDMSQFWTHNNQQFGGTDIVNNKEVQSNFSNRQKIIYQHLKDKDPEEKWDVRKTYIYTGGAGDRVSSDRIRFLEGSAIHQLQVEEYDENGTILKTIPPKVIKPNPYHIDKLLYETSNMHLYPMALLDKYTENDIIQNKQSNNNINAINNTNNTANNSNLLTNNKDNNNTIIETILPSYNKHKFTQEQEDSFKRRINWYDNESIESLIKKQCKTLIVESDPTYYERQVIAHQQRIAEAEENAVSVKYEAINTIPYDHIITKINPDTIAQDFAEHINKKANKYFQTIDDIAAKYIKFNHESFMNYINNKDGYLDSYIEWEIERDMDRVNWVRNQRIAVDQARAAAAEAEKAAATTKTDENKSINTSDLVVNTMIKPNKAGQVKPVGDNYYGHINVNQDYVDKRLNIVLNHRRIHPAFMAKFPYDLRHVSDKHLKQMLYYIGGDLDLYKTSPVLKNMGNRALSDIELEQYTNRYNIDGVCWLHYILNHTNDNNNNNNNANNNTTNNSTSPSNNNNTTTPVDIVTSNNNNNNNNDDLTMSDLIIPTQQTINKLSNTTEDQPQQNFYQDIKEAMPVFIELCHRHPILTGDHGYQYISEHRINIHNAIMYMKQQIAVIDSIPIPDIIKDNLEEHDISELKKNIYFGLNREALREPILNAKIRNALYKDAKKILRQMNGYE